MKQNKPTEPGYYLYISEYDDNEVSICQVFLTGWYDTDLPIDLCVRFFDNLCTCHVDDLDDPSDFKWIGRMLSSCVTNEDSGYYSTYSIDNLKIT